MSERKCHGLAVNADDLSFCSVWMIVSMSQHRKGQSLMPQAGSSNKIGHPFSL